MGARGSGAPCSCLKGIWATWRLAPASSEVLGYWHVVLGAVVLDNRAFGAWAMCLYYLALLAAVMVVEYQGTNYGDFEAMISRWSRGLEEP